MEPMTAMMIASAVPAIASAFMPGQSRPSGPDYSQIMAMINSPEMQMYKKQLMETAYNPNSDIFRIASDRAYAQGNRAVASRGLGTSGAGMGFIQQGQNDLANKFAEGEFQRRLQAFNAINSANNGVISSMTGMANNQYDAGMANYNAGMAQNNQFVQGIGSLANAGISAYTYNNRNADLGGMMGGYTNRAAPGAAGSVYGAPVASGGYNYGFGVP